MTEFKSLAAAAIIAVLGAPIGAIALTNGVEGARHAVKPIQVAQADRDVSPAGNAGKKAKSDGKPRVDRSVPTVKSAERTRPR